MPLFLWLPVAVHALDFDIDMNSNCGFSAGAIYEEVYDNDLMSSQLVVRGFAVFFKGSK